MPPPNLYARVRILLHLLHTRPRVRRAPGLPCALVFEGKVFLQNFGRNALRECGGVSSRHCERSEAIHLAEERKNGLLRFARNDG